MQRYTIFLLSNNRIKNLTLYVNAKSLNQTQKKVNYIPVVPDYSNIAESD